MAKSQWQPQEIPQLAGNGQDKFTEWKIALFINLGWHGLMDCIQQDASACDFRKRIHAYVMIRGSVSLVIDRLTSHGYQDPDPQLDAKKLYDALCEVMDPPAIENADDKPAPEGKVDVKARRTTLASNKKSPEKSYAQLTQASPTQGTWIKSGYWNTLPGIWIKLGDGNTLPGQERTGSGTCGGTQATHHQTPSSPKNHCRRATQKKHCPASVENFDDAHAAHRSSSIKFKLEVLSGHSGSCQSCQSGRLGWGTPRCSTTISSVFAMLRRKTFFECNGFRGNERWGDQTHNTHDRLFRERHLEN